MNLIQNQIGEILLEVLTKVEWILANRRKFSVQVEQSDRTILQDHSSDHV
jgi:hypothetical protein